MKHINEFHITKSELEALEKICMMHASPDLEQKELARALIKEIFPNPNTIIQTYKGKISSIRFKYEYTIYEENYPIKNDYTITIPFEDWIIDED